MAAQRHAVLDFYEQGARVVSIDDDIRDLCRRENEKVLRSLEPDEWQEIVAEGFRLCGVVGARIWGLYPVTNPYFMKPKVRTSLSYLGGGLFGAFNDRSADSPLRVRLEDKEDFERSLACYARDGALVRFDYVCWKTEAYEGSGGMQADGERTRARILANAQYLAARYPDLATLNLTKKSGKAELRLRDRSR